MPEFELYTEDMDETEEPDTITLPKYIGQRAGRKAFQKLDVSVENGEPQVDDIDSMLDAKEYIVRHMLKKRNVDIDVSELAMPTFNQIANHYWSQVMEARKKKEG